MLIYLNLSQCINTPDYHIDRIILQNLENNKINFKYYTFHDFINIENYFDINNYSKLYKIIHDITLYYFEDFIKNFKKEISTDNIILCSCGSFLSIPYIADLLNNGYKLIVGGQLVNTSDKKILLNSINNLLHDYKLLDNIIFYKGEFDLNVDINKIINEWKDVEYNVVDFSYIKDCFPISLKQKINDLYNKFNNQILKNYYINLSLILSKGCIYNNCKYCLSRIYNDKYRTIFTDDELFNYIKRNIEDYNINEFIFRDNEITVKTIKQISNLTLYLNIKKFQFFTSIKEWNSKEFVSNIENILNNVNILVVFIGVDNLIDDRLKNLGRNYTYEDVLKASKTIKKLKNKYSNKFFFFISWIKDLPASSEEEVIENYKRYYNLLKFLTDVDDINKIDLDKITSVHYLKIFNFTEYNNLLELDKYKDYCSGFFKHYVDVFGKEKLETFPIYKSKYIKPFIRIDIYKKILFSDEEILKNNEQ